jgi:hypothetical protein
MASTTKSVLTVDPYAKPPGAEYYGDQDISGVDVSLIRHTLSLSPLERLQRMEQHARDTLLLMDYGRRAREAATAGHR